MRATSVDVVSPATSRIASRRRDGARHAALPPLAPRRGDEVPAATRHGSLGKLGAESRSRAPILAVRRGIARIRLSARSRWRRLEHRSSNRLCHLALVDNAVRTSATASGGDRPKPLRVLLDRCSRPVVRATDFLYRCLMDPVEARCAGSYIRSCSGVAVRSLCIAYRHRDPGGCPTS